MFLVRFVIVAVCLVMLLPTDPELRHNQVAGASTASFCTRYPKTCDASGEVWSAFKRKLTYGIKLARQSLEAQSDPYAQQYGTSKLGGRLDDRRQTDPHPANYANETLSPAERSGEWYRDH